jgi:hypothetical protein
MLLVTDLLLQGAAAALEGKTLRQTFSDLGTVLVDVKFLVFLILLGIFFWIPFWSFFNLGALYIEESLDRVRPLPADRGVPLIGQRPGLDLRQRGRRRRGRISGDALANTGLVILVFQLLVSRFFEKWRAMPAFLTGLLVSGFGFVVIGLARVGNPAW